MMLLSLSQQLYHFFVSSSFLPSYLNILLLTIDVIVLGRISDVYNTNAIVIAYHVFFVV